MFATVRKLIANPSISVKIAAAVLLTCMIFGTLGGWYFSQNQQFFIDEQAQGNLKLFSVQQTQLIEEFFVNRTNLIEVIGDDLENTLERSSMAISGKSSLTPSDGEHYLDVSNSSIGFFPKQKPLTAQIHSQARVSDLIWQRYAKSSLVLFDQLAFVSKAGFARIYRRANQQIPDSDKLNQFITEPFLQAFSKKNINLRQTLWHSLYYDEFIQKWSVAVTLPLVVQSEYQGVIVGIVALDQIHRLTTSSQAHGSNYANIIFDSNAQILYHYDYLLYDPTQPGFAPQLQDPTNWLPQSLAIKLNQTLNYQGVNKVSKLKIKDDFHLSVSQKIETLDWYIISFQSISAVNHFLLHHRIYLIVSVVLFAVLLSVSIYFLLKRLLLQRLSVLASAVANYDKGVLELPADCFDRDELGTVATALDDMARRINNQMAGLKDAVSDKDIAELRANKLSSAVQCSGTAIAILDDSLKIEYANPKFCKMIQMSDKAIVGVEVTELFDEQMVWVLESAREHIVRGAQWKGELLLKQRSNEDSIWVSQTFSPMDLSMDKEQYFVSVMQDISFIKQNQNKMEKLAYHDPLTGLYNRTFFVSQLNKALEMTRRGHYQFALFYFDLDQFKRINDTLGHEAGDELLNVIAGRLVDRLRAEDTIARLGGDEFAIMLSGIGDEEKAANIATSVQKIIRRPIQLRGAEVLISASIGITLAPKDTSSIEALLRNADLAMYRAKSSGRSTYFFFNDELNAAAEASLLIESELRNALKEKQFELYYQPQVNLSNGELFGFEALIRWNHPVKGLVAPDYFISVAEQTGLIVDIGEWVMAEACQFIHRLNARHKVEYTVSVNLSARQFNDKNVVNQIKNSLINARITPEWLDIELTESMLMGNVEEAILQMKELKKVGIQISIDDFGTGYSSLAYLKKFPVDTLKVDRAFVKDIPNDKDDMAIAAAIIAMAHELDLKVIAEGVETKEHVDFLSDNRCQVGQGYLISKPLPESKLEKFITGANLGFDPLKVTMKDNT